MAHGFHGWTPVIHDLARFDALGTMPVRLGDVVFNVADADERAIRNTDATDVPTPGVKAALYVRRSLTKRL